jgi:hypothetical protein
MALDFVGRSRALSENGFAAVTGSLAVQAPEIWSVLSVETSGRGFLDDRRPPILYERHIFHRLTGGKFDDGDISDPQPGGYGAAGAHQYDRLARAIALDRGAALESASWGLGQILGQNFAAAGFGDVEAMVAAMIDGEDAQLAAVAAFLRSSQLDAPLQAHDWTAFARGYNGPSFQKNEYDKKLQQKFEQFSAGPAPDLTVRAAQLYLSFLGLDPGPIDGIMGQKTRAALATFQQQHGLATPAPAAGELDAALLDSLTTAALG